MDTLLDGLYLWHKPEHHDAGFEKFKSHRYKKDKTMEATMAAPPAGPKQGSLEKLTVSQRLKEVLCSNIVSYETNAYEYCKQVCE